MPFLDTNVLISFAFVNENNHQKAKNLILKRLKGRNFYISSITIFEIYSVIPRRIIPVGGFYLPNPLQQLLNSIKSPDDRLKRSIETTISYLKNQINYLKNQINFYFCTDNKVPELGKVKKIKTAGETIKLFSFYILGMKKSYKIKLKTLDLLQLVYVHFCSKEGYPCEFVTLDDDIKKQAHIIQQELGIKILA